MQAAKWTVHLKRFKEQNLTVIVQLPPVKLNIESSEKLFLFYVKIKIQKILICFKEAI